ncbi:kinase-like domain-containing protein [Gigaspora rosea]|uniref:Kinase-like domain-containing protein n=1 Tax=Gigaspora rosea TaxID=44941 RepID=A0A397VRP8_9GLOM|nr:kinase-like domain-containing protein [Gigaspora rosea]
MSKKLAKEDLALYIQQPGWMAYVKLILSDVKEIGKGGFGFVYSATWLDGIRKIDVSDDNYVKAREPSSTVALKTLASSKENDFDFLKEFKSLMKCKLNYGKLAIYGITQNIETNEYLMVFQYANNGSLRKYLKENFSELTWQTKLQILKDISDDLDSIHRFAKYIHVDFHSGNILQDQCTNKNAQSYITDLGLSRKKDECVSEGGIIFMELCPMLLLKFYQASSSLHKRQIFMGLVLLWQKYQPDKDLLMVMSSM